jgi:hypothetical protein
MKCAVMRIILAKSIDGKISAICGISYVEQKEDYWKQKYVMVLIGTTNIINPKLYVNDKWIVLKTIKNFFYACANFVWF